MTYEEKHKIYIDYMRLKIEEKDWHGVSDAANDLRELECSRKYEIMVDAYEPIEFPFSNEPIKDGGFMNWLHGEEL